MPIFTVQSAQQQASVFHALAQGPQTYFTVGGARDENARFFSEFNVQHVVWLEFLDLMRSETLYHLPLEAFDVTARVDALTFRSLRQDSS